MIARKPDTFYELASLRMRGDALLHTAQLRWLDFSIAHNLYHVFENELGAACGYMIWAYVCDDTVVRLYQTRRYPTYIHEWDEGVTALILDVAYSSAGGPVGSNILKRALPRDIDKVVFVRGDRIRLYRRVDRRMVKVTLDAFIGPITSEAVRR